MFNTKKTTVAALERVTTVVFILIGLTGECQEWELQSFNLLMNLQSQGRCACLPACAHTLPCCLR